MAGSPKINRRQIRLALLLVGILGLAFSATVYYLSTPAKVQTAAAPKDSARVTAVSVSDYNSTAPAAVLETKIPEAEASAVTVQAPELAEGSKSNESHRKVKTRIRSNSRNRIASRLPFDPPPVTEGNDFQNPMPRGQVEMWSGDRRAIISVPRAPKNDTFGEYQ